MENFAYNNVDYLELKSVSFGYNDNEVLHDVSMRLEKGGRYAIIGPSGSGKTTIINTITGLYSANSGAIAINESLLDGQHLEEWRRWFTVVSQDNLLFSTTIKENLFLLVIWTRVLVSRGCLCLVDSDRDCRLRELV